MFIVGLAGAVVRFYAEDLRKSDMTDVEISGLSFWTFPPARTATAREAFTTSLIEMTRPR